MSTRPRILVVDDEPDTVTFLTTLLADNGYEAVSAGNGAEALAAVRAARPALVTLDISMPEQSGVKAYRQLKEDAALATIPVVIVTGIADDFKQFISTRKQVPPPEGYLSKPIVEREFLDTVKRLVRA